MRLSYRIFSIVALVIVAGIAWSAEGQTEFKLNASDATEEDEFGISVSIDGDYAIVGARNDDDAAEVASGRHGWPPKNPGNQRDRDHRRVDTSQYIIYDVLPSTITK